MGDALKVIGGVASAFIPGAAPIVAAVSSVASAFGGTSTSSTGGTAPEEAILTDAPSVFRYPADSPVNVAGLTYGDTPVVSDFEPTRPLLQFRNFLDPTIRLLTGGDSGPLEAPRTWVPSVATGAPVPQFIGPAQISDGRIILDPTLAGVAGVALPMTSVGGLVTRGIQAIEAVVPKWILRAAGGAATATSVYELYKRLRGAGHSHKRARRLAIAAHGIMLRRRRMRVTNIHALNRAIRRLRGFQRKARKVRHLFGHTRYVGSYRRGRRHFRRGDLDPFLMEDQAEMMDEAEDYGLEPRELAYE